MAHGENVGWNEQVDLFDLKSINKCHVHLDQRLILRAILGHNLLFDTEAILSLHDWIARSLHQGWIDVSSAVSVWHLCSLWVPESSRVVYNEAETVWIFIIVSYLDADMRGVMPEKEPTNDCENYVKAEEYVAFPLDHVHNLVSICWIEWFKDGLLDNSL